MSRLLRQEYASLLRRHVERAVEFRERAEQYAAVREAKEESAQQQLQFQQQQQPLLGAGLCFPRGGRGPVLLLRGYLLLRRGRVVEGDFRCWAAGLWDTGREAA